MAKKTKAEPRRGGVVSRQTLYQIASKYSKDAIDTLYELMMNSRQESVRMGAAKVLLDKALPDLRSTEVTGDNNGPVLIKIIEDKRNNNNE